jgi:prolyl-tRNA editing enzyme YbaK/EbsC (Cys-tRNA(Pro) deacylase)
MSEMHPTALRFQERAQAAGLDVRAQELSESTRTAVEAAEAVGCELGQIVKSVVLQDASGDLLLCLCAGDQRIDLERVGEGVTMARGRDVKEQTGYAIGGIPPLGHAQKLDTLVDARLMALEGLWAAAGHPNSLFPLTPEELVRMTGGRVAEVAA